jgi:hypothetical protein
MNRKEINCFFNILSGRFHRPAVVILTGASCGSLYGSVRPSLDIDFALKLKVKSGRKNETAWQEFADAVRQAAALTGIQVQYAEDIDRWSQISFLDYANHTRPYRKFGRVEVRLLDPAYWAIGKLTRYLDPDIRDVTEVLQKTKVSWKKFAELLGRALRKSPKSTACYSFRRQVEDFFRTFGKKIWAGAYSAESAISAFHKAAGIARV